jgi:predicted small secreted protein
MKKLTPVFVLLSLTLTACGTASVARRDLHGGEVALSGGYMKAMRDARLLMAEACAGHFASRELQGSVNFECGKPAKLAHGVTVAQR